MGIADRIQAKDAVASDSNAASEADPADAAIRLGIPERDVTPRVRVAIAALTGEVARLRREIDAARKKLMDAERAADQDTLLPILNRRAFMREIARFIAFAERYGTPASLIYFDLDGFKSVNDVHGHAAGDAVLQHFVTLLASHVRGTDVVGRLGGDEFGLILSHATLDQARIKGESLCKALHDDPPRWQGKPVIVRCSYGAYELRAGESADIAMANADQAMYANKREQG